jgi:hypothetical protein
MRIFIVDYDPFSKAARINLSGVDDADYREPVDD